MPTYGLYLSTLVHEFIGIYVRKLSKIVDLTQYFNEYLPNDIKLSDNAKIFIIKNNIFIINDKENKRFLINVDDKLNDDFNAIISLDNRNISKISNFISGVENFRILFYEDHINIITDDKREYIFNIKSENNSFDFYSTIRNSFDIDFSNEEKIEFKCEFDDTTNYKEFDMYLIGEDDNYFYFIGNSKLVKNLKIRTRIPKQEFINIYSHNVAV